MKASELCVKKIKEFEGCRLKAYKDSAGVLTIGFGHTKGVTKNMTITLKQAEEFLRSDIEAVETQLMALRLPITHQGEIDSLVDFIINLGIGNFKSSTLRKKIEAKAPAAEIQKEFKRWVYSGGKVLKGLVARRNWEAVRWMAAD